MLRNNSANMGGGVFVKDGGLSTQNVMFEMNAAAPVVRGGAWQAGLWREAGVCGEDTAAAIWFLGMPSCTCCQRGHQQPSRPAAAMAWPELNRNRT